MDYFLEWFIDYFTLPYIYFYFEIFLEPFLRIHLKIMWYISYNRKKKSHIILKIHKDSIKSSFIF